jgi:hypothetical protein
MKVLALALAVFIISAHAQTATQVGAAQGAVRVQINVLQSASENLIPMAFGQDERPINSILGNVNMSIASVTTVLVIGDLLPKMRDPEDAKVVRAQLEFSLAPALQVLDNLLKFTNGYMALLKSPAAVAEATKVRDAMIVIRNQLRSLVNSETADRP